MSCWTLVHESPTLASTSQFPIVSHERTRGRGLRGADCEVHTYKRQPTTTQHKLIPSTRDKSGPFFPTANVPWISGTSSNRNCHLHSSGENMRSTGSGRSGRSGVCLTDTCTNCILPLSKSLILTHNSCMIALPIQHVPLHLRMASFQRYMILTLYSKGFYDKCLFSGDDSFHCASVKLQLMANEH